MGNTIYTATGCVRCKITKSFMAENGIEFEEVDFQGDGKDAFGKFYRANRKDIYRDQDGVEFPVFSDGRQIRQGVSVIIGYLVSGGNLDGFIKRSRLHGEWIDGFDVSGGEPEAADGLIRVLTYLKSKGLKIELHGSGGNPALLEQLLAAGLGDRIIMEVRGPANLMPLLQGAGTDLAAISKSLELAARFPECRFVTDIVPVKREGGEVSYLTPEEVGDTAKFIEEATGSKKNAYRLRAFRPDEVADQDLKGLEPLPAAALFKYRGMARRFQVFTEVEK